MAEEARSQLERFEILILGSGEAGKLLAWHIAGPAVRSWNAKRLH
jgi:hypothetical protein